MKLKFIFIFVISFLSIQLFPQERITTEEYIETYKDVAVKKINEFKQWTSDWDKRKAEGKWKEFTDYGILKTGKIGLQDHGNKIWFRNIKTKSL